VRLVVEFVVRRRCSTGLNRIQYVVKCSRLALANHCRSVVQDHSKGKDGTDGTFYDENSALNKSE